MAVKNRKVERPIVSAGLSSRQVYWIAVAFLVSGVPALIYQTVWQRLLVLHSGVGTTSVAIIVSMYMIGLGVGSLGAANLSKRVSPNNALYYFAGLEIFIALYAFASPSLLYDLLYMRLGGLYANGWLAAVLHFAALFLPTCAMGATLPFMTRAIVREQAIVSKHISLLYGLNTLGAALGAVVSPWILMPYLGIKGTISLAAAINLSVALTAIAIRSQKETAKHVGRAIPMRPTTVCTEQSSAVLPKPASLRMWFALYSISGLCAVALEILWFRMLDIAVKSTSFTFGTVLGVYLFCLACGSIAGASWSNRLRDPLRAFLLCQCAVLASSAAVLALVQFAPFGLLTMGVWHYWGEQMPHRPSWSEPVWSLVLYCWLPLVFMGLPTALMGLSFCAMQRAVQENVELSSYRVGLLQFGNILGCTLGSLVVGLWLIEALGTVNCMRCILGAGIGMSLLGIVITNHRQLFIAVSVSMTVLMWVLPSNRQFWQVLHGQTAAANFYYAEDLTGVAALTHDPTEGRWTLLASGKGQSSIPFGLVHSKLGALPVALHANPQSIAIVGLGSGGTAWAALSQTEVQDARVFEICSAEESVLSAFTLSPEGTQVDEFLRDPRLTIDSRDARFVLMTQATQYDIIEADAILPYGAFAGYLYSEEFFQLCSRRLKSGGLMCSWAPTPASFATFRKVFPYVIELDGGGVLIGSQQMIPLDQERWRDRIRSRVEYLGQAVVDDCIGAIDRSLVRDLDVSNFPTNTDLIPIDEFN